MHILILLAEEEISQMSLVMGSEQLDDMISEAFSNLNESPVLWFNQLTLFTSRRSEILLTWDNFYFMHLTGVSQLLVVSYVYS